MVKTVRFPGPGVRGLARAVKQTHPVLGLLVPGREFRVSDVVYAGHSALLEEITSAPPPEPEPEPEPEFKPEPEGEDEDEAEPMRARRRINRIKRS